MVTIASPVIPRMPASLASRERLSANSAVRTRVRIVTIVTAAWAPFTRSVIGTPASPKRPRPNVIAQTTVIDVTNAPAIGNAGRQRAVSHNSSGSTTAAGVNESQDPAGWITT